MKRIIAGLMCAIILLSTMVSLAGCTATTADAALSMGQWVTLIAESFGMQNYVKEEPYFKNVKSNDSDFAAFQMVAEWNIITPSDEITAATPVKWNDVLISLVNAGEFLNSDATDEEKIDFAIENFDSSIRTYWGNRYIKLKEAVPLLDIAQKMWANKEFDKKIEKAAFADSVVNNIDADIKYVSEGNRVITSADELMHLKSGDIYTLPANESTAASINKVKTIEYSDGKVIITNDEVFTEDEISEYVQEIKIQETSSPDFTKVAGIYDENGNPINYTIDTSSDVEGTSADVNYQIDTALNLTQKAGAEIAQTAIFDNVKGTLKFKVKKYSISLSLDEDSVGVELSKEIEEASNRYREYKKKIYGKATVENVKLTKDVDYSWGILHSATVKLDYKTTIESGLKTEKSTKIGNPAEGDQETKKSLSSVISQYKNALENISKEVRDTEIEDEIYICKLTLIEGGISSLDFVIKGEVTTEGEMKLVFEIEGAQGIQYKDGKLRYIKSKDVDCDFAAEGSLEVTIAPGIVLFILKELELVDISLSAGLGASVGMTAHLFDVEGHELYSGKAQLTADDAEELSNEEMYTTPEEIEAFAKSQGGSWTAEEKDVAFDITLHKGVCLEWKLYPILRFRVEGWLANLVTAELTVEFLGNKNTILEGHIDFPNNLKNMMDSDSISGGLSALLGVGAECTYDYTPWDKATDELDKIEESVSETEVETETETGTEIVSADKIVLSTMRVTLGEGKSAEISVTGLPKGYELKDLEAECEDPDIAEFDIKTGKITGKKEGTTQFVVKTTDGKYKAFCAVTVTTDAKVDFSTLAGVGGVRL